MKSCPLLDRAGVLSLGGVALALGCAPSLAKPSATAPHADVSVGRRCGPSRAPLGKITSSRSRVFVEVAQVLPGQLPDELGDWLEGHSVSVRSVANLLVTPTRPAVVPWGECLDEGCDTRAQSWSASLQLPERSPAPLQLALELREGTGTASERAEGNAGPVRLSLNLELTDQRPAVVPDAAPAVGSDQLLITAYLLVESDDLLELLRCKSEQIGADEIRPNR